MGMNDQTPQIPYTDSTFDEDFPNLRGYIDDTSLDHLIESHTTTELLALESAFDTIESAMITIRRTAEIDSLHAIWLAITTIWDNSHDLLDD